MAKASDPRGDGGAEVGEGGSGGGGVGGGDDDGSSSGNGGGSASSEDLRPAVAKASQLSSTNLHFPIESCAKPSPNEASAPSSSMPSPSVDTAPSQ